MIFHFWVDFGPFPNVYKRITLRHIIRDKKQGGERNKPLGFLTLGKSSLRKKNEESENYFVFSCSSLVVFLHLMF